jgi:DNA-binding response OmpR family regulator
VPMVEPAEIRALLVSRDQEMVAVFSDIFRELGIAVQGYADESSAALGLQAGRFEALVLDFDNLSSTRNIIAGLRESPSSKNALVFAVASGGPSRTEALEQGVNFSLERPFNRARIKEILHTAYGLMLRERRRYFRHPISLPVRLRTITDAELQCTSINISRNGMALQVPSALDLGDSVKVTFALPNSDRTVKGEGTVVWDDKHGKAGLSFQCETLDDQNRLGAWLDNHFYRQHNPAQV